MKLPRPNRAAGSGGYILGRPARDVESGVNDPLSNGATADEYNDTTSIGAGSCIGASLFDSNDYNNPNSIIVIDDDDDETNGLAESKWNLNFVQKMIIVTRTQLPFEMTLNRIEYFSQIMMEMITRTTKMRKLYKVEAEAAPASVEVSIMRKY